MKNWGFPCRIEPKSANQSARSKQAPDHAITDGGKNPATDRAIFGESLDGLKQAFAALRGGDDLRDSGSPERPPDGEAIGVENEGAEITPLYGDLYSQKAPDFVSENDEILRAARRVSGSVSGRGIWVIDRGGDRGELYDEFVPPGNGLKFLIRQRGDRHVWVGGRKLATLEAARSCVLPYRETIIYEEAGRERVVHLEFGFRSVRLPAFPEEALSLVVVRGFGLEPMMLLTNVSLSRSRKRLWWVLRAYITRWRIEETIRFAKQSYSVEDVRIQSYERLRNVAVLVLAAMYFAAAVLGRKMKLKILAGQVLKAAKRLFGIPDFRYYALADGICEICREFSRKAKQSVTQDLDELPLFRDG